MPLTSVQEEALVDQDVTNLSEEEKIALANEIINTAGGSRAGKLPLNTNPRAEGIDMTKEISDLLAKLDEINGQDAYSSETVSSGKLRPDQYLALPKNFEIYRAPLNEVGTADIHKKFTYLFIMQVYALNKTRCSDPNNAIRFALLRMEAVKMGWFDNQKEVVFVDALSSKEATDIFKADHAEIVKLLEDARSAAFVIPLFAEHVFRTTGHHYLTSDAVAYLEKYKNIARASLVENVIAYMPPSILFHEALHWVSPARARGVLDAQRKTKNIPEAVLTRSSAAPAGTAIITTSIAVLDTMRLTDMYQVLIETERFNIKKLIDVCKKIRDDPAAYHKSYFAYGRNALTKADADELAEAKKVAESFAPIAQGYIDANLRMAALGKAKALRKHADGNPVLYTSARNFFRNQARMTVSTFNELININVKVSDREVDEDRDD